MEETKTENLEKTTNVNEVKKERLSPAATVLITIAATLGTIVIARIIYFIITGA